MAEKVAKQHQQMKRKRLVRRLKRKRISIRPVESSDMPIFITGGPLYIDPEQSSVQSFRKSNLNRIPSSLLINKVVA
jgi:hypothetical protein